MTEIPANPVTMQDLTLWFQLQDQLKKLKTQEMLLRQKIFKTCFPEPKEGTNTYSLDDGFGSALKGTHVINREVDPGALQALRPEFVKANINADALVQFKPSLKVKEYRELTAEQNHLFDQCLIIKPGSPSLEIIQPKKRKE
jgi:hypothetical protein